MSYIIQSNGKRFYTERELADINPCKLVSFVAGGREELKAKKNIPCGKEMYYELYRKFFWLLDKRRD